jgi:hypothetical protein
MKIEITFKELERLLENKFKMKIDEIKIYKGNKVEYYSWVGSIDLKNESFYEVKNKND